jgi:hypothetical protein
MRDLRVTIEVDQTTLAWQLARVLDRQLMRERHPLTAVFLTA